MRTPRGHGSGLSGRETPLATQPQVNCHEAPWTWHEQCSYSTRTRQPEESSPEKKTMKDQQTSQFERERKWCAHCGDYVRYLMSVNHSYCVQCGNQVRLFNKQDSASFFEGIQRRRWESHSV